MLFKGYQSWLTALLSSLIARPWIGPQTLWRFQLKNLSIDERVGAWSVICRVFCPAHRGYIAPVFSFMYCWVLIFVLSHLPRLSQRLWILGSLDVHRPSCLVRRVSSTSASNDISSWTTGWILTKLGSNDFISPSLIIVQMFLSVTYLVVHGHAITLVNVNAPVVATTSWWLHFSAPVVA